MKKLMTVLLAGAFVFSSFQFVRTVEAANNSNISVLVDGRKVTFQGADPVMENSRVQIPLRGVGEALDAKVGYSGTDKKVTYTKSNKTITLTVGSKQAIVDGKSVMMDTAVKVVKGRAYVPLRFVSENLGETVNWDPVGGWVWIGERNIPSTDDDQYKLIPMSEFKEYTQTIGFFTNVKGAAYTHVKIIKQSDLPIRLADSQIVYGIDLDQEKGKDYLRIRSSARGNPIAFLVKNSFARGRHSLDNAFINNGDNTGMNYYPVKSSSDHFQNGKFIENYDYNKFQLREADYILLDDGELQDYAVVIENALK